MRPREIHVSLQKLHNFDLTTDLRNVVNSLEKLIQSFEFIIMTALWFKALQAINNVSVSLQVENISLDNEMKLIKTLIEDLTRLRSSWHKFIDKAHLIPSCLTLWFLIGLCSKEDKEEEDLS